MDLMKKETTACHPYEPKKLKKHSKFKCRHLPADSSYANSVRKSKTNHSSKIKFSVELSNRLIKIK